MRRPTEFAIEAFLPEDSRCSVRFSIYEGFHPKILAEACLENATSQTLYPSGLARYYKCRAVDCSDSAFDYWQIGKVVLLDARDMRPNEEDVLLAKEKEVIPRERQVITAEEFFQDITDNLREALREQYGIKVPILVWRDPMYRRLIECLRSEI